MIDIIDIYKLFRIEMYVITPRYIVD